MSAAVTLAGSAPLTKDLPLKAIATVWYAGGLPRSSTLDEALGGNPLPAPVVIGLGQSSYPQWDDDPTRGRLFRLERFLANPLDPGARWGVFHEAPWETGASANLLYVDTQGFNVQPTQERWVDLMAATLHAAVQGGRVDYAKRLVEEAVDAERGRVSMGVTATSSNVHRGPLPFSTAAATVQAFKVLQRRLGRSAFEHAGFHDLAKHLATRAGRIVYLGTEIVHYAHDSPAAQIIQGLERVAVRAQSIADGGLYPIPG